MSELRICLVSATLNPHVLSRASRMSTRLLASCLMDSAAILTQPQFSTRSCSLSLVGRTGKMKLMTFIEVGRTNTCVSVNWLNQSSWPQPLPRSRLTRKSHTEHPPACVIRSSRWPNTSCERSARERVHEGHRPRFHRIAERFHSFTCVGMFSKIVWICVTSRVLASCFFSFLSMNGISASEPRINVSLLARL